MPQPTLRADCPHCATKDQGFTFQRGYAYASNSNIETIIFSCNGCSGPVAIIINRLLGSPSWERPIQFRTDYSDGHFIVMQIIPSTPTYSKAPQHTPENIALPFEQGCRALQRGDWDIAGMGFRKAIDIATKKLIRDARPADLAARLAETLYRRIEWLHSHGQLTTALKDWAHIIRDEGNDAAHEEEPYTEPEANQLQHFAHVFLLYTFTIPGTIAAYNTPAATTPAAAA